MPACRVLLSEVRRVRMSGTGEGQVNVRCPSAKCSAERESVVESRAMRTRSGTVRGLELSGLERECVGSLRCGTICLLSEL